jgi:hypothetical protein
MTLIANTRPRCHAQIVAKLDVQPMVLDLTLYAGDGFSLLLAFTDELGAPWDASGSWTAQVRATPVSTEVQASFTVDTTEAATGKVRLTLTGEEVRAILTSTGKSVWDVEQIVGGVPRTWYRGDVTVVGDVTRVPG